jgi:hypothetical protein
MEPIPNNAVAVEWQFRCRETDGGERAWDWQCRSKDGCVIAHSAGLFQSLKEAVADAGRRGFNGARLQDAS